MQLGRAEAAEPGTIPSVERSGQSRGDRAARLGTRGTRSTRGRGARDEAARDALFLLCCLFHVRCEVEILLTLAAAARCCSSPAGAGPRSSHRGSRANHAVNEVNEGVSSQEAPSA